MERCLLLREVSHPLLCRRSRAPFTKKTLKNFIRVAATRKNYTNAPWIMRDSYIRKYHLAKKLPQELAEVEKGKEMKKRKRDVEDEVEDEKKEKKRRSSTRLS